MSTDGSFTARATTRVDRTQFGVTAYRGRRPCRPAGRFATKIVRRYRPAGY